MYMEKPKKNRYICPNFEFKSIPLDIALHIITPTQSETHTEHVMHSTYGGYL